MAAPPTTPSISRVHATIRIDEDGRAWTIRDNASRNGIFINGRNVESHQLRAGDQIRIGPTVLAVEPIDAPLRGQGIGDDTATMTPPVVMAATTTEDDQHLV
ncbi:MAG: FHA domain-containing protein, partial [Planctomycetota bacterium]